MRPVERTGKNLFLRLTCGASVLIAAMLLAGCANLAPRAPVPVPPRNTLTGVRIARIATRLIGSPYHFGGADAAGFDCSGLAVYAHLGVGLEIPRTAAEQNRSARQVGIADLQPGDLVFFRISRRHVDHVGIYAGAGRFVHAPRRGELVSYASLEDAYYRGHFVGAGRFWTEASTGLSPHRDMHE